MFDFPLSTLVNTKISKKTFYQNLSVSTVHKKLFVEQITSVYWKYKLTARNLKVSEGCVDEIEVLQIELSQKDFSKDILKIIDRGIPYHTVFIVTFDSESQLWIAHKQKTQGESLSVGAYYNSEWKKSDELELDLIGTSIDTVYANIFYQIAPYVKNDNISDLNQAVEKYEQKAKLQKEITRLEKLAKKEKQPKKKFEIVQQIKALKEGMING